MKKAVELILLVIILTSCYQKNEKIDRLEHRVAELERVTTKLIKSRNDSILVSNVDVSGYRFQLYQSGSLFIEIKHLRPIAFGLCVLSIPGAYTTRDNQIDGLFIERGVVIQSTIDNKLTGACIVSDTNIQIMEKNRVDANIIKRVVASKSSLFQQSLLVLHSRLIVCDLFGITKRQRRALVQFKTNFAIVESEDALSIQLFQGCLLKMGVVSAVNLDMGSWSEGWYIDSSGQKVEIGDNKVNTSRQTNWLVFSKM
jgi:hypothetical protein